jgi:hypothetical protein
MILPDMSTAAPTNQSQAAQRAMKTRDKIKFAFAGFLGIMTFLAIAGLTYADYQRKKTTEAEEMQIQQTLSIYGEQGALPDPVETHGAPPTLGTGIQ